MDIAQQKSISALFYDGKLIVHRKIVSEILDSYHFCAANTLQIHQIMDNHFLSECGIASVKPIITAKVDRYVLALYDPAAGTAVYVKAA